MNGKVDLIISTILFLMPTSSNRANCLTRFCQNELAHRYAEFLGKI